MTTQTTAVVQNLQIGKMSIVVETLSCRVGTFT